MTPRYLREHHALRERRVSEDVSATRGVTENPQQQGAAPGPGAVKRQLAGRLLHNLLLVHVIQPHVVMCRHRHLGQ